MMRFDNRVVIITGAGGGLGREYALFYGSRGGKVVVNDLGGSLSGESVKGLNPADRVVQEIKDKGGVAVANYNSVEDGDQIVKTAVDAFGKVDIVINNAGILRDVSFQKMTDKDWDLIMKVHLKGTYSVTRAAWNIMREQKYGRIINTSSGAGLYGNFGQVNYSTAKLGIHGFTQSIAKEGEKRNILCNSIAPIAASRMTATVLPQEALDQMKPEYVVPLVAYLTHESSTENGSVFELGAGFISKLRWQRSQGVFFDLPYTIEDVKTKFSQITDFTQNTEYPQSMNDIFPKFNENMERQKAQKAQKQQTTTTTTTKSNLISEEIFGMMNAYVAQGLAKPLIPKVSAIFNFNITQKKGGPIIKTWIIDLKNGQGNVVASKSDSNADATFTMIDQDFESVCLGKLNPQMAFIQGKMKIKGNMKKASLFTPELFPKPTPENKAKYMKPKL